MRVEKLDTFSGIVRIGDPIGEIYKDDQGFQVTGVQWHDLRQRGTVSQRLGDLGRYKVFIV